MTVLSTTQRATLTALVDALLPAVDGHPSASQLGVVETLDAALGDVDWNGERWFADAPHESAPHPGHGWQGDAAPTVLLGRVLDRLAEPVRHRGAEAVVESAVADEIPLEVVASSDLVRLLQRHVLIAATGASLR